MARFSPLLFTAFTICALSNPAKAAEPTKFDMLCYLENEPDSVGIMKFDYDNKKVCLYRFKENADCLATSDFSKAGSGIDARAYIFSSGENPATKVPTYLKIDRKTYVLYYNDGVKVKKGQCARRPFSGMP